MNSEVILNSTRRRQKRRERERKRERKRGRKIERNMPVNCHEVNHANMSLR